ncbi:ciliaflagella57-likeassociated and flagella-associated 57-like [Octopus vulgaris]|uniref:Ciliaflagella57-likeassociated and flagella-associated 57-like n=1 Tax=Octopus vulgaris TaxID=6645 RepID=A0AA36FML4_OCTVU|nr:ciliaflagella57-likeassociated and flagella-associated 57-like [Octopus vulgaris]
MKLFKTSQKGSEITAIAISTKRNYTAIALKCDTPSVNIFELYTSRKSKSLVYPELLSAKIISMCFSNDSRYLITLCDDQLGTLLYWSWEKSKLLISSNVTTSDVPEILYHITFNPHDNLQLYVFGNGHLKSLRIAEGIVNQFTFPKIDSEDFKCYCWDTNNRLLVGTNTARVLFIEDTDLVIDFKVYQYLDTSDDSIMSHGVTAIASYAKGFITACGTKSVQFFGRIENKDTYEFVRNVWMPSDVLENGQLCKQIIKWMVVSPSEEVLVIITDMKQMYSAGIVEPELKYMNKTSEFDVLVQPFHFKSITGCCVCTWKPFIATSSLDGSIKLWNYETFTLEFSKDFSEEVYSISMHPMGLFLLAGFNDKLRFMHILMDDLKSFQEFNIRMCTHCNFSRGGHMFAAVNNNFIQVYSSITFEMVVNLKGHNDKVKTTAWFMDDNHLLSCGLDGAVYDWELKTGKRIGQCVLKSCAYNDVVYNPETKNVYAVGSDHSLKEIHESDILRTFPASGVVYTSIALSSSNSILFLGTSNGYIKGIECPPSLSGKFFDYPCHSLDVTHLVFSADDRYLISASKDATIAIWKVNESDSWTLKRKAFYCEEILIPISGLEDKNCLLAELNSRVDELVMENKFQMHFKEMHHNDNIKETTDIFIKEIEELKAKNEILKKEKYEQETMHCQELSDIQTNNYQELQKIEFLSDKKLILEYEKYAYLFNSVVKQEESHEKRTQELQEKQESIRENMTKQYEKKLVSLQNRLERCHEELFLNQKEHEEVKKQAERDADMEIDYTVQNYKQQLVDGQKSNSKIKDENNILKKKLLSFPKELKDSKDECKKYKAEIKRLNVVIFCLDKDIEHLQSELRNQDEGFQDEEKCYYESKLKNHELEMLKCELEYKKITELRQHIEHRETQICDMKEQIKTMQRELENFTHQFIIMDRATAETKQKLAATSQELDKERTELHKKTALLDRFLADLIDCTSFIQDPLRLKSSVKLLYQKYIDKNVGKIAATDPNIQMEWARQRNHFEYSIHTLMNELNKTVRGASLENEVLVNECSKMGDVLKLEREKSRRYLSLLERTQ